jgi:hypothetical protein
LQRCKRVVPPVAAPRACNVTNCSIANCNATSYITTSLQTRRLQRLQRQELIALKACNACNVIAPRCRWPSSWSSRAFCDAMTSNITLQIFVSLGTFIRLLSIQGHSSDFCPSNLRPTKDVCPRTFVHRIAILHPAIMLSYVLPSCHFIQRSFVTVHSH